MPVAHANDPPCVVQHTYNISGTRNVGERGYDMADEFCEIVEKLIEKYGESILDVLIFCFEEIENGTDVLNLIQ